MRYLVELDHNPEHQILWRLAFLETDPIEAREAGSEVKPPEPMFPGLAAQYGGNPAGETECERDRGHGAMAIATRREVNTAEINKQADAVATFKEATNWDGERKRFRMRPDLKSWPAFTSIAIEAAHAHQSALLQNYQKYADVHDSDPTTVDAVKRNGPQIIGVSQGYLSGMTMTGPMLGGGGGSFSGVGMRADPVQAELVTGSYTEAKAKKNELAPQFGAALQTHHMIEQKVLEDIREAASENVKGARAAVQGELAAYLASDRPTATLKAGLEGALESAAGRVHDRFVELQTASLAKITPNDPSHPEYNPQKGTEMPSPRMVYVGLKQRMNALSRQKVIEENRKVWAA